MINKETRTQKKEDNLTKNVMTNVFYRLYYTPCGLKWIGL